MKKTLILGLSLIVLNISHARDLCPNLLVTESSKIKTILRNTKHDYFGESDEIELELSSSTHKLNENQMFSDWLGVTTYKQSPEDFLGRVKSNVPFFNTMIITNKEVKQGLLYGRHLNLVMIDLDIEVPLASGSIEVPFHFAAGGNHDDLIFSKSIKLDLSNHKGLTKILTNDLGDELEITISPLLVKKLSRVVVQAKYLQARAQQDQVSTELKQLGINTIKYLELKNLISQVSGKIAYLKDLLDGKIENSCAE